MRGLNHLLFIVVSFFFFFPIHTNALGSENNFLFESNYNVDNPITQRGDVRSASTGTTTLVINKPTGVVEGDVLFVSIALYRTSTSIAEVTPSISGWTRIGFGRFEGGSKNYISTVLYRIAGASEPASYSFDLRGGTTSGLGSIVAFYNVDITGGTPFDIPPTGLKVTPNSTSSSVIAPGIITNTNNAAILMFTHANAEVSWQNSSLSAEKWRMVNPSDLTEVYDLNAKPDKALSIGCAWGTQTTAGPTGDGQVTSHVGAINTNVNYGTMVVALKSKMPQSLVPVINSSQTANSIYGTSSSYLIRASNYPTSYAASSLASGMTINTTTGEIIIAANTPAGVYTIGLSATNESGTGEMTLVYTVSAKELTIEANDVLKCYGVNQIFNTELFTSSGLVLGEIITAVDMTSEGSASLAAVGSYAINTSNAIGANGFNVNNYQINYLSRGTIAVRPLNSWHGSINTEWTNIGNWCLSTNQIPGINDVAIIYPSDNSPELGGSSSLKDLVININASILLKTGDVLNIYGSLINDGTLSMVGNSRVIFNSAAHTIGGITSTSFNNLTINSGTAIAVNESISVSGQLALTSGYLVPAAGKVVVLDNGSTIIGVSNSSYVRGAVKKIGTNGNANYAFDFPIGKHNSALYDPVRITFPNASATEAVTVSYDETAFNTTLKNSNVRDVASEFWTITPSTLVANSSGGLNVKLHYKSAGGGNYFANATNTSYYKVGHFNTSTNTWEVAVGLDAAKNSTDAGSTLIEGFASANGVTNFSRFTMIEITSSVLPVHLTQFNARLVPDNKVLLNWSTDQEQQNKGFAVERASSSSQGKFQKIGYVFSKGTNGFSSSVQHYQFNEQVPIGDQYAYYRILQEDIDGKITPSEIRLVKFNNRTPIQIAVGTSTGEVTVSRNKGANMLNYRVIDQIGRMVGEGKSIVDQVFTIKIPSNGIYTVYLQIPETGEQLIKRVMIQK